MLHYRRVQLVQGDQLLSKGNMCDVHMYNVLTVNAKKIQVVAWVVNTVAWCRQSLSAFLKVRVVS
jgi:hypothetical protein